MDVSQFVDDRPSDRAFRLRRDAFHDAALYEAEMSLIYERDWIFLCHESQIANAGDYFSTHIGREPVFVIRQKDGSVRGFMNACAHRGAILTPYRQGTAGTLTCRFHGWAFASDGRCIRIKNEDAGFAAPGFDRSCYNLNPIARVDQYRGFYFGTLDPQARPLIDHIGEARFFIDMFADQSPDGLEVLSGSQTYVCDHNWKLQAENVTDGYHVSTVHRNFANAMVHREDRDGLQGMLRTDNSRIGQGVKNGSYYLGNGHMAIWSDRGIPDAAPLHPATTRIDRDFAGPRADWMLRRGRNVLIFPNMVLNDLAATHLRTHRPLSPTRTEITIWCIAPKGEPAEARFARLRKFEDFFLVTGLATSDDVVSLDTAQAGCYGSHAGWNEYSRGITQIVEGPDETARELGMKPEMSFPSWDHETTIVGLYRHWRRLLETRSASLAAAAE
jgi:benzoate/toluate 1,2-dioxygenase alpha subunit